METPKKISIFLKESLKKAVVFLVAFLFVFPGSFVFGESDSTVISSGLQENIKGKETVEVVVRLNPPERQDILQAKNRQGKEGVVNILESNAKNAQAEIKNIFSMGEAEGRIINSFWVANAILVEVNVKDLDRIASRKNVWKIHENFEVTIYNNKKNEGGLFEVSSSDMGTQSENRNTTWGVDKIGAPQVWDMGFMGSPDIKVAVLDTGVDITHPDLEGKMYTENEDDPTYPGGWAEFNSVGVQMPNSEPHDVDGHGTHVSGTVVGGNESGNYIGVAPGTKLMHGLVLPGGGGTFAQVTAGMEWAVNNGADVINMSFGAGGYHENFEEHIQAIIEAEVVPVVSIGNDGEGTVSSPGAVYESFAIGASSENDEIASFSGGDIVEDSRNDTPNQYIKPDFSAPGVSVLSAHLEGGYASGSGTSMAAPHVAGAVALILQASPGLEVDEIYNLLKDNIGYYKEEGSLLDDGEDQNTRYGYGIINVYQVVLSLEPNQLTFTEQPTSAVAGEVINPEITVEIQDGDGGLISGATNEVTIEIENDLTEGEATLSGTLIKNAVGGVAVFDDLSIDKAEENYTLKVTASGLSFDISSFFNITPGDADASTTTITADPLQITADGTSTSTVIVQAKDEFGNELEEGDDTVILSTTTGTISVVTDNGDGTYTATLTSSTNKETATITGTINEESITDTTIVEFIAGDASGSETIITADPLQITADGTSTSTVTVQAKDEFGNELEEGGDNINLSTDKGGLSTVTDNNDGTYTATLTSSTNVETATVTGTINEESITNTATVEFVAGDPAKLDFDQQPTNTTAGESISPDITVQILDANDNLVNNATNEITVEIEDDPTEGETTLSGTLSKNAVGGVAVFNDLSIDKAEDSYTLKVTANNLDSDTSNSFDIEVGDAYQLSFDAQPTETVVNQIIEPVITVRIEDSEGNLVNNATHTVEIAIENDPTGEAILSGILNKSAVGGVVTFDDLEINEIGSGYTLKVSADGLIEDISQFFDILSTDPEKLSFDNQPGNTTAGEEMDPPITVEVLDVDGNLVSNATNKVTIEIENDPTGEATLSGTTSVNAIEGVATFNNLSVDKAGENYTLKVTASGLSFDISSFFNITPGDADAFTTTVTAEPTKITADGTSTSTVIVQAKDEFGNELEEGDDTVILSTTAGTISSVTDNGDGTYTATLTSSTNKETATITGTINTEPIGDNATVEFVAGDPAKLNFDQQPTNTNAGESISPDITVQILDANDNLVNDATNEITVEIEDDPTEGEATLSGTLSKNAVGGVAVFNDLSIDKAEDSYTLKVTATELSSNTSNFFNITSGNIDTNETTITANPTEITADGSSTSTITVQAKDEYGNNLTSGGDTIILETDAGELGEVSDMENGTYTAILTSSTNRETATVTGIIDGKSIEDTATVDFRKTSVETMDAVEIGYSSAELRGEIIEIEQNEEVKVFFEWRRHGQEIWTETNLKTPAELVEGGEFEETLEGLETSKTYYFRAVVQWKEGEEVKRNRGDEKDFVTVDFPAVETKPATDVSYNSAVLHGDLLEMGVEDNIDVWFEYRKGEDSWESTDIETFNEEGSFSVGISGLSESTTYEFKAMMEWNENTEEGSVLEFTTGSRPSSGGGGGSSPPDDDDNDDDSDNDSNEGVTEEKESTRVTVLIEQRERLGGIEKTAEALFRAAEGAGNEQAKEVLSQVLEKIEELQKRIEESIGEREEEINRLNQQKERVSGIEQTAKQLLQFATQRGNEVAQETLSSALDMIESLQKRIEQRMINL